ncbi:hypothetical protein BDR26DRAFT_940774 [Obelidium mucronatum]|nr:hypothetical protein BDR26DRAFT_940774 [Obelidium mucronatum]
MTSQRALMPLDLIIALFEVVLLAVVAALVACDAAACAAAWHQAFTAHYHFGLAKDQKALVRKCQSLSEANADLVSESRATGTENRNLKAEVRAANAAHVETESQLREATRERCSLKHQLAESRNRELDLSEDLARLTVKEKDTAAQLAILIREARGLDQEVSAASILGAAQTAKVESLVSQLTWERSISQHAAFALLAEITALKSKVELFQVAAVPLVPSAAHTIIALEIGAPIDETVSLVSEVPQNMDALIANLPPLPESPASLPKFEVLTPQPAAIDIIATVSPVAAVLVEVSSMLSCPAIAEDVSSVENAVAPPVEKSIVAEALVPSPAPFADIAAAPAVYFSVSVKEHVQSLECLETAARTAFTAAARLPSTPPSSTTTTTVHQSAELSTAAELVSPTPLTPSTFTAHQSAEPSTAAELVSLPLLLLSTTTVHQSAELSTAADLVSLAIFRDQGEGDDVDAMFIDMPDTEAPVCCFGNDWAADMAEAEDHEEAMVAMLTACLQGNVLDVVAPAAEESLVASDATADTDLFAFCETSPVMETCVAHEAVVIFGDADVVMQEAATQDEGLMEAAAVEDRPQLAESLKRRQLREPASIAKRHARAARETAARLEVSVAVEADEDVVMGTVEDPPTVLRVARKEYSWAARVERLALAARRSPVPSQQGLDGPAVAVVARSAEEASSLDIFASVCCAQAVVLPLAMEEIDRLAEIEAQAPVALTLLSEARQILDAIEPEEDMTEEDLDDLFSE